LCPLVSPRAARMASKSSLFLPLLPPLSIVSDPRPPPSLPRAGPHCALPLGPRPRCLRLLPPRPSLSLGADS
jgi:hypothetical protein